MAINLNKLAKSISEQESGAEEVSIAQIKEILKITLELLAQERYSEVLALLEKYS